MCNDYYPFGMLLPGRHGNTNSYRYGFQGQEMDDEIKGEGNSLNYTYRMHDPRIGRFFATDPLEPEYPWYSPYQFNGNKPIAFGEVEGLEEGWVIQGEKIFKVEGPTEQVANSFTTQENAEFAMSQGFKSPAEIGEFLELQSLKARFFASGPPKGDIPMIYDAGLEATMNKYRHANPGMTIARGLIDGAGAAPEVILPEIAVAKLAKLYSTYKASRLATKAAGKLTKFDDVVHPEFLDDLSHVKELEVSKKTYNISGLDDITPLQNKVPDGKAANHIFSDKPGKFPKSESSVEIIESLVNDQSNFLGLDKFGKEWFAKTTQNGEQIFGVVQNGVVKSAGKNKVPLKFKKGLGLKKGGPNSK